MESHGNGSLENDTAVCYPLLYIPSEVFKGVGNALVNDPYTDENITLITEQFNDTEAYILPAVKLDISDSRSETIHTFDSAALLLIMFLLFLTIITIWLFKVGRFRILHETGLSLIYGIAVGVFIRYAIPSHPPPEFYLAQKADDITCSQYIANITEEETNPYNFQTGENVVLVAKDGHTFVCEVLGRVFRDENESYIQQTLLFDPELFFFALLPPIIFYAGYTLAKRHFFRNLGSLLLYAFIGTTVSAFIVGGLMYGYSVSGAETEGSSFANLTGQYVPAGFAESIIPSLLFGSLISATDPVTVLAIFHDLHVDVDLYSLVFGESVMNDAVAIVLFRSVDEYSGGEGFEIAALFKSIGSFLGIFLGSFILGCAMGLLTALLMKFSKLRDYPLLETSMFVIMSYSTFLFAEFAQLTGIVAVLFCGIMQSYYTYINLSEESRRRSKELLELINFLAENFVFSYMGLSLFTFGNHQWVPGFILFSFVTIFAGRVINIYILSFLLNLGRAKKISFRFQHMLVFAGLRGAIAFALAIRNTQTNERQLIFTTTLMIVMVTVFICGGFTTLMLQLLRIPVGVEDDSRGLMLDGEEIPHDPKKGNWFISKFSKFDKLYLIPIFTHRGRPINSFCCNCCLPLCTRCKPESEKGTDSELSEDEESDKESEEAEGENILSFRHQSHSWEDEDIKESDEGDLGLGDDQTDGRGGGYQRGMGYQKLAESQESAL